MVASVGVCRLAYGNGLAGVTDGLFFLRRGPVANIPSER